MVDSVYRKLEEPGPGRNLYTQKFRARAGSWSRAYTRYSKKLGQGEICILKNSGPGQVLVLGRIQDTRKNWAQGEICILKFSGARQVRGLERIQKAQKARTLGEICILKNSEPKQVPGPGRIQDTRKNWARAKSVYSKIQDPGRFLVQGVYLCAQKVEAQAIQASYLSEYTG